MSNCNNIICSIVLLTGSAGIAVADVYDDIVKDLEVNNISLQSLREESIAEITSTRIEGNLPATDVEMEHVWSGRGGERKWSVGIAQEFDFPGVYYARNREIKARREALDLKYRASLTDLVIQARELLTDVAYCNKAIELETMIVEEMKSICEFLERSYSNGESTILEVNRAKIELANNMVKLRGLNDRRMESLRQLKAMGCDIGTGQDVGYRMASLGSLDEYHAKIETNTAVAYYQQLKRAEILGSKTRVREMYPGFKVGYVHEYEEGTSFDGFSIGLSLPLFSNRGKRALSKSLKLKAELDEAVARIERESVIDVEYSKAKSSKDLIDILGPVFNGTSHAALLGKAYRGGQMSVIDYLREVTYFRESEWDFLELEMEYFKSLNRLESWQ